MYAAPGKVRSGLELIRPHPHRGDLIAAGAVPLAIAVALINLRFDDQWGVGILLVVTALPCALLLAMGMLAPPEGEFPRAYVVVLLLSGLALLALSLVRLAEVLGADDPLGTDSTVCWMAVAFAGVAAFPAWERSSPVCALLEAVAGGVALLAFVDWVFDPESESTFRWILLALIVVYTATHLRWRERRRRHAVHMVNAAGLAAVAIGVSFLELLDLAADRPGAWWEIVLLGLGLGLVAYAGVDRERGPAYLGVVALALFVVLAGPPGEEGASLIGWPLLLLLLGGAAVAAGLRPLRPLPPPPDVARDPAPTETLPTERIEPDPTQPLPPDDAGGEPGDPRK
jgi:hypothetical protein